MQFVSNGPDIPEALLQAHEDGRVVFFCGAGISYPAGLPNFKGLVDRLYLAVGTTPNAIEDEAYKREQYDTTLDLLERRLPGDRLAVRKHLSEVLMPMLRRKGATDTHAALLQLACTRDKSIRLVTTNFDRIFQRLIRRAKPTISSYPAPMLPIPKNSRWNGIVYLHGLLPEKSDHSALHRLVLTSGDFGLAYLTERWAARFVSELFRNYIVCFVGYSINDAVLRYMMDALAADRMLGEVTPQAYALSDFSPGQQAQKYVEWKAKGVTPLLYGVPEGTHDHSVLHRTLKVWANVYSDGVQGRERVVVEYAMAQPLASSKQDDYVGRMLWALSHNSGLPAKRFAEFNPAPSLDWLKFLSEERYRQLDLPNFGISTGSRKDEKLTFSVLRRPAHYIDAPWMMLVADASDVRWDDVMIHLGSWLLRHLDDPTLILWLTKHGVQVHGHFISLIEQRLNELARLERGGAIEELNRIRANAPAAIPRALMRTVWSLLISGRVGSLQRNRSMYRWKDRLVIVGLTTALRFELRDLLTPRLLLKQPFRLDEESSKTEAPKLVRDLLNWELIFGIEHLRNSFRDLTDIPEW